MEDGRQNRVPKLTLTVKSGVKELTPAEVAAIVEDALAEWLPGYTEYDENTDSQWRVSFLGNDRYRFEQSGAGSRVFTVSVTVTEEQ